ncbi:Trim71 [Symbiodinium sp. CCMP2592]|nr:Trim71 [Symbiodinium sp. CCMP2592]
MNRIFFLTLVYPCAQAALEKSGSCQSRALLQLDASHASRSFSSACPNWCTAGTAPMSEYCNWEDCKDCPGCVCSADCSDQLEECEEQACSTCPQCGCAEWCYGMWGPWCDAIECKGCTDCLPTTTTTSRPCAISSDLVVALNQGVVRCREDGSNCTEVVGFVGTPGAHRIDAAAVAVFRNGDYLLTTDNKVKRCPAEGSGTCTTVAGQGGKGSGIDQLDDPRGLTEESNGDFLVADKGNGRVQRCPADGSGKCSTVAGGNGEGHKLNQMQPGAVMISKDSYLISDLGAMRVLQCFQSKGSDLYDRCVAVLTGLCSPVAFAMAPNGEYLILESEISRLVQCASGSAGPCARVADTFETPRDFALASNGEVIVADYGNSRIRRCRGSGSQCRDVVLNTHMAWPSALTLVPTKLYPQCKAGRGADG